MKYDLERDNLIEIVKNSDYKELEFLADDIRSFLIDKVSETGGHLASNLGVVELTMALHRVFNSPEDRIVFDVGHQAYVHKILTGRADQFDTLRQYKGMSGFPKSRESVHDAYETGHSSTSISAALGMATARDLQGENYDVVAVIGDGSLTGGLVYEALNNLGASKTNMKIILNDNGMSISHNVGGLTTHLSNLRTSSNYIKAKNSINSKLDSTSVGKTIRGGLHATKDRIKHSVIGDEGSLFEHLGIKYFGPFDGHDIEGLCNAMEASKLINKPVIIHVITTKGKGYTWAEKYPRKFHGIASFDIETGDIVSKSDAPSYSKVFGETVTEIAANNDKVVAIAAAMGTATGLGPFYDNFPERYFDVGIAEEHATVFAAGLAKSGQIPVLAIYSSFMQRAIDMIIEDICLQNLHVVFALDRAGLVGADGETHHGQFDLSYLTMIPNVTVLAPADGDQLKDMLDYAINELDGPVAIRYPRGSSVGEHESLGEFKGSNITMSEGSDITILAVGAMLDEAKKAATELRAKGYSTGVRNIAVVKPMDLSLAEIDTKLIITVEDNGLNGGFGQAFAAYCKSAGSKADVMTVAIPDSFIEHGSVSQLRVECGIDAASIVKGAVEHFERKA
ncbi:MAG: 1-deoxy-D-xylulose-5-phosphate synthase [Firmicutes bacterium]|nr:1-deoxy-D-xylulose-5-phosphate synthase [Bacillota bacterium]